VGSRDYYKLYLDLVLVLHSKEIVFLAHAISNVSGGLVDICWNFAQSLDLSGSLRDEWDSYVMGLKHSSFLLSDSSNFIMWS